METQQVKLKYYTFDGEFVLEGVHQTELIELADITNELSKMRERAELPGTRLSLVNILFETAAGQSGLVLLEEYRGSFKKKRERA